MKKNGIKFSAVTAYDYPTAMYADKAGIDVLLVGDSKGHVKLGMGSTLPVTMDSMIESAHAVRKGAPNCFIVGDLPYMSYQVSNEDAVRNAARFIVAGCDAVKLEGPYWDRVKAIVKAGICVSSHLGLLPQRLSQQGGYRVSRDLEMTKIHLSNSTDSGAELCLFEGIPEFAWDNYDDVISWGIGAGKYCDGQLLISDDLLGLFPDFTPKFVKKYCDGADIFTKAFTEFKNDVSLGNFPEKSHCYE